MGPIVEFCIPRTQLHQFNEYVTKLMPPMTGATLELKQVLVLVLLRHFTAVRNEYPTCALIARMISVATAANLTVEKLLEWEAKIIEQHEAENNMALAMNQVCKTCVFISLPWVAYPG